jgi:uncharacterized damage-inducible protein DinB
MLRDVRHWYAYARWANGLMLDACETVPTESLARETGSSFGSIFGTLHHLHAADWLWLERFEGRSTAAFPPRDERETVASYRAAWDELQGRRDAYLASLTEERLAEPLAYRNMKGEPMAYPLGELLFHVSNHATYHRGQVMQAVRQSGGRVASSDYLYWLPLA